MNRYNLDNYICGLSSAQTEVKKHKKRNTKQNSLALMRSIVCVTPNLTKCCFANQTVFYSRNIFSSEHVRNDKKHPWL